jgi:hypothetical protein
MMAKTAPFFALCSLIGTVTKTKDLTTASSRSESFTNAHRRAVMLKRQPHNEID